MALWYNERAKGCELMKKKNRIAFVALVLALLVLCSGCGGLLRKMENSQLRSSTEAMLDALIAEDFGTAYGLVSNICSQEEFQTVFVQLRQMLEGAQTYELQLLQVYTGASINDGQRINTASAVYKVTTPKGVVIAGTRRDDRMGLTAFQLTPYEKTDYYFTGTLGHMRDAGGIQWLLLLLNVISVGFGVFALVDCARKKIKNKVLWIILLSLGFATVGVTLSGSGFRMNFNLGWLTAYSALIRYGSGAVTLRLMLPVGAAAYFCMRRSLLKAAGPAAVSAEQVPAPPEQPEGEK